MAVPAGRIVLLAAVYFMAAKASLLLAIPPGYATPVWPPSGIALAALLLFGSRMWPGIWLGAAITNFTIQGSPLLAVLIGTGNTLEAVVAAALIRGYVSKRGEFETVEAVAMFVAFSALSALIAATIGSVSLKVTGTIQVSEFSSNAWIWLQGDASGMMIFTPLILTWYLRPLPRWNPATWGEAAALGLSVVVATMLVFRGLRTDGTAQPLAFVTLPFLLWAAIRFEQRAVTMAIAGIAGIALCYTVNGRGPFSLGSPDAVGLILLAYASTLVIIGLFLSVVIGQRRRAELAVRQRVHELQESERHVNEFLAMLSHELRNPLAPMVNALALMRQDSAQNPPMLGLLDRQVAHLSHIVDDLLDVSRITRGKIRLQKETAELGGMVARALESARPLIDGRGHALELDLGGEDLFVHADATRICQVALNLINNSAKYTPAGGRISISLRRDGSDAVLKIKDTGMGIPPKLLPRVFDLFIQGDRALDRSEGGLGIGLTIAKRIVEMHGGSTVAFSEGPGKGAEFVVRLPLVPAPAAAVPVQKSARATESRRILVVDDHRDSADSLATLLRMIGHEVKTSYDGQDAIELAAQYRPQLVLLDIGLPGKTGYEVARELRNAHHRSQLVLIAVSGYGQEEDRRRGREAGFDYHLVKPVDPAEIEELIGSLTFPGLEKSS
ncbi:MAG TPA: MASE1 domain-containing protein [Burkholderiales bacterium]|nr:MASE1 domain-containing protein [Burkholderiales bacterium]